MAAQRTLDGALRRQFSTKDPSTFSASEHSRSRGRGLALPRNANRFCLLFPGPAYLGDDQDHDDSEADKAARDKQFFQEKVLLIGLRLLIGTGCLSRYEKKRKTEHDYE